MSERPIEMTTRDARRLRELLIAGEGRGGADRAALARLRREVERAQLVAAEQVGRRVVTMESRVLLRDLDTHEAATYVLVYPEHADLAAGRLSVLAPIGMAVLGYREGDVVEWEVPAGSRRIRIEKVLHQPEAAGHEHLESAVGDRGRSRRPPDPDPGADPMPDAAPGRER